MDWASTSSRSCGLYARLLVAVAVVLNHFANLVRVAKLDGISQFVMAYGGLRGAIAFSLAVVLDRRRFQSRQLFITTTIVVVYFTNIVLVGATTGIIQSCSRRDRGLAKGPVYKISYDLS